MRPKTYPQKFKGYSNDRYETLRKQKEELFHQKYGRFANKNSSLTNSKESTMMEPGALFAMDNLFEDTGEKMFALSSIGTVFLTHQLRK